MTTLHLGDHENGCAKCAENCGCGTCEQNARIEQNMDDNLEYALATGDFDLFMDIFEDRDPFEFM